MDNKENEIVSLGQEEPDELLSPLPADGITPRHSLAQQSSPATKPTPYANLRHLAGLIRRPSTPGKRLAAQASGHTRTSRLSATPLRSPKITSAEKRVLQPTSGNWSNPATPHAVRALHQRRNTPGFDRRKSGRIQRETPREVLRNLSKAIVKVDHAKTSLLAAADEADAAEQREDVYEDELSPEQPHLTLPLGQDDDSFDGPIPRLSIPIDGNDQTVASIEIARRRPSQQRISGGGDHESILHDQQATPALPYEVSRNSSVRYLGPVSDDMDELSQDYQLTHPGGDTEDLRTLMLQRSDKLQRLSDTVANVQHNDNAGYSPFVLQIPGFAPRESDFPGGSYMEERAENDDRFNISGPAVLEDTILANGDEDLHDEDPLQSDRFLSPIVTGKPLKRKLARHLPRRRSTGISQSGVSFPKIPAGITKRIATSLIQAAGTPRLRLTKETLKARLTKETLKAIRVAGDMFLGQLGGDLSAMARHAGRRRIDDSDVIDVMRRQRRVTMAATAFALANEHIPQELLHRVRVPLTKYLGSGKKQVSSKRKATGGSKRDHLLN